MLFRLHRIFALLLVFAGAGFCQSIQPVVTGRDITADPKTGVIILRGSAKAQLGEAEILADEIRYQKREKIIHASGSVVLTTPTQRLLAARITYWIEKATYTVEEVRAGQPPLYLSAERAFGEPGRLVLRNAMATWNEPGAWTPTMKAQEIEYELKGAGRFHARRARIGMGDTVPVMVPEMSYNLDSPLHSSATLRGGYRGELGAFVGGGLRWPIATGLRVGGDMDVYSKRGVLFGPGAGYSFGNPEGQFAVGELKTGFINDHGERDVDILGSPVPERRGFVAWEHRQKLTPELQIDAAVNYWRDSEVLRDFRRNRFVQVQTPDTAFETTYTTADQAFTLLGRFQPNSYHEVQERLPELRWDLFPRMLLPGWYGRGSASMAFLREDPVAKAGSERLLSDRFDVYYGLTRDLSTKEWLGLTPVLGGRVTHYRRTLENSGKGDYTRTLGEIGFDAHLLASGVFDYRNPMWNIDGLRHLVKPYASYRFVPEADKGRRYIPMIDRQVMLPHMADIGLADPLHIDDLHRMNVLRVGVDNRLQTRDAGYGSRDLARFSIANDFRFSREAGQRAVSPTYLEASASPLSWFEAAVYQSVETRDMSWQQTGASLTLRDADVWTLRFSAHHLKSDISEYAAEYGRRLNETFTAYGRWRYDARRGRWYEQSYDLGHNLGNAWHLRYGVTLYDGPRKESSFQFHIEVETRAF